MGRCGLLVIGPAGSGKSTFCDLLRSHAETLKRRVHVINLDPAAEHFAYPVAADIRSLISLEEVRAREPPASLSLLSSLSHMLSSLTR